jgi:hypothetical protein
VVTDTEKVMDVLDIHRWKVHGGNSLTCECGAVLVAEEEPTEFYHSKLDELFRRHIAEAVVIEDQLTAFTPEMVREVMEQAWEEGYRVAADTAGPDDWPMVPPNPYRHE